MLKNIYHKVGVWRSTSEVASYLANSCILYKDHGLLAINKPFNLGMSTNNQSNDISLNDVLPELQSLLRLPVLDYISSPEKFATGLLLLGTDPETKHRVALSKKRSMSKNILPQTYITLTDGIPRIKKAFEILDASKVKTSTHERLEPVLSRSLSSKRKLTTSKALSRYLVHTETLSTSCRPGMSSSLVAVSPSSLHNHFIHLYMADLLSPLLGDFIYSYRVRRVNNYPIKVSHNQSPPNKAQRLPPGMLKALGLRPGEEHILPKHLHKHRLVLTKFIQNKEDLVLRAPPPTYFMETAAALGVSLEPLNTFNHDHLIESKTSREEVKITV
eukprot:TRINITY_DN6341_c0_g1_i1.p1 TRINITY_DN6341_c0_g1~~TRINITY_DN6341_c0_g1_i1.p1  ORF type:complete len:330 (-),score=72.37 TRINITY_DN6341_c0_g1_i1:94-1083(-)